MRRMAARGPSRLSIALTLVCVLAGIFTLRHICKDRQDSVVAQRKSDYKPPTSKPDYLAKYDRDRVHLLVPANRADARMCRTLTSALINDYPSPTIINWETKEGDDSMNGYDMTTGKNWGVLKYLRNLPAEADQDLVIMVDAYDVIFQLPLDIALQRYEAVNVEANSRLSQQHGESQVLQYGLRQSIIMGAEKYCWPLDHRHPACWAVPPSPIPANAYGRQTDKGTATNRPRWLNSGTVMGPVGDLRRLYEWAHVLWMAYDTKGGDQDYFSNIYGRQELSRQRLRGSKEWLFGFGEWFKEKNLIWPHMEKQHTDYHLGVDLTSTVFQLLNKAVGDMSPVVHRDSNDVEAKGRKHGTSAVYGSKFPFPDDLLASPMPKGTQIEASTNITWLDVTLLTNFHARSIPAILHYNGDVKSGADKAWPSQWWTGRGRDILRLRTSNPNFGIATDANKTLQWQDICGQFENKLIGPS
ncbi:hypothetical protein J3458_021036 [Metarhizium acridum]|uniref:uncharacterized protein n=1 Tax=Metarhizium acridum TaxID=92637 RepID=UPI001C6B31D0|nr:hypothetical protein J3458_021036 [Metarhizium acridum]